jgi:peptidoglycan/xylan/chitin deacetylase (PgdA/CDA1 family)
VVLVGCVPNNGGTTTITTSPINGNPTTYGPSSASDKTPTPPVPPTKTPPPTETCTVTPTPGPSGTAYITIDDGPGGYTSQLLNVLDKYPGVKVTFFLVGDLIDANKDEVRQIEAHGHAIGIHSWSHPNNWQSVNQNDEINKTQAEILNVTGKPTNLFRAPGGGTTFADLSGLYNYNWTNETYDDRGAGDAATAANIVLTGEISASIEPNEATRKYLNGTSIKNKLPSRPIVLMHAIHPIDPDLLDNLIQGFQSFGYGFGTLPRPGDPVGTSVPIAQF